MSGKFRKRLESPYCNVPRQLAQNNNLTLESVGLMTYLLSKPADWEPQIRDVEKHWRIGREKRQRLYGELETEGYFERIKVQNPATKQWEHDIVVHAEPIPEAQRTAVSGRFRRSRIEDPGPGFPATAQPQTAHPAPAEPATANPVVYIREDIQNIESHKGEEHMEERESVATPQGTRTSPAARADGLTPSARMSDKKAKPSEKAALISEIAGHAITEAIGFICDLPPWKDCRKTVLEQVKALAIRMCNDNATSQDVINFYDWKRSEKSALGQIHFILTYAIEDWRGFWAEFKSDPETMECRLDRIGRTNYGRAA